MTATITKDRVKTMLAAVRELTRTDVLVGIPSSAPARRPEEGESNPPDNATIGFVHEFGSPANNIPARPFLRPGIAAARPRIVEEFKKAAEEALDGKGATAVQRRFDRAGLIAQSEVRKKIQEGPFVALSPRTLAQRKARGRTGIKPLLDTGQMRNAVTYVKRTRKR